MKNTDRQVIVVFDSGVGGLPYLARIRELLPDEHYSYVADTAYFPYGEKSAGELSRIIHESMERIIERMAPKLAVIACNTASVVALSKLRAAFGIPFIGVVPAIKPAAECTKTGRIGLLATRKTVDDPYTDDLQARFADNCRMYRFAGVEIVELVERNFFRYSKEQKRKVLQPAVDFFLEHTIDQLVIACTHFIFLEEELRRMLGGTVSLVDSRDGVARQTRRILEAEGLRRSSESPASQQINDASVTEREETGFFVTEKTEERVYRRFAEEFGLKWRGVL